MIKISLLLNRAVSHFFRNANVKVNSISDTTNVNKELELLTNKVKALEDELTVKKAKLESLNITADYFKSRINSINQLFNSFERVNNFINRGSRKSDK